MSMLSGQADKLRKEAQNMRDFGRYEMEQMLLDAADTIWELRDDLQRANAENAKLREFASEAFSMAFNFYHGAGTAEDLRELKVEYYELGIEVDG